jgi:SAM-dependent methyltransferase
VAEITSHPARFDRIARLYRAMEVLSFGPMLERCRFHHLPALRQSRRALVLGDGDGRFLARLLAANPVLHADAIDASPVMLGLLRARASRNGDSDRLTTTCADARDFRPQSTDYDLVATHFFLDCLTEAEADQLIARLRPHLVPSARWLVSEFQIPADSRFRAGLARGIISSLYAAFRLLTGLTVREIPPWPALLARHGFTRQATHSWLGGLLVSEVWELREATAPVAARSHSSVTHTDIQLGSIPGIDPGPEPFPGPPPVPTPDPAPGPPPEPDPEPYPGPLPAPQPVTRAGAPLLPAIPVKS